jgi:hypothetical protein
MVGIVVLLWWDCRRILSVMLLSRLSERLKGKADV